MDYRERMTREELVQFFNDMEDIKNYLQKKPDEVVLTYLGSLPQSRIELWFHAMTERLGPEYRVEYSTQNTTAIETRLSKRDQ